METAEKTSKTKNASGLDKASHLAHEAIDNTTLATYEVANTIVDKGDELSEAAHETVDKITTTAQQTYDRMIDKKDRLRNAEQQLLETYSTYIRQNPITSVGIAAGVGFLLSKLFNNR
ncbi:MAG: DUF883 family protein [Nitrosomonas sp.]